MARYEADVARAWVGADRIAGSGLCRRLRGWLSLWLARRLTGGRQETARELHKTRGPALRDTLGGGGVQAHQSPDDEEAGGGGHAPPP